MSEQDFKPGLRFAIAWLHERANSTNNPHAKQVLDSAAFSLGQAKTRGGFVYADALSLLEAQLKEAREVIEDARHKMWEYGFSEDDLQPIRAFLAALEGRSDDR